MIKRLLYICTMSIFVGIIMYGCAGQIEQERDATFYKSLGDGFQSEAKYKKAIAAYENALMRAETPEFASEIQLSLADTYFLYEEYNDAIPVYETYVDVYADSPSADLAYVRLGLSHYELINRAGRDQTDTVAAKKYFDMMKIRNPAFYERYELGDKTKKILNRLAQKEIIVAKYYSRILKREPAKLRYKYVADNYSDTDYYPQAVYRLVKILVKEGKIDEASNYVTVLKMKRPFDSYTEDAEKLIKDK